jgi:protein O-GlcNAc transferase
MLPIFRELGYPELLPLTDELPGPFWSVVVPVHNRTTYLRQCLESVIDQFTRQSDQFELIVVDTSDVPTEMPGLNVLSMYRGAVFQRIKTMFLPDLGPMENWNQGIRLTHGKWVFLLNDDDYVLPGFFDALRRGIEANPSVGAGSTGYENETEGVVTFRNRLTAKPGVIDRNAWLRAIGNGNPLNTPAVVIKRETYEKIGLYRPDILYCADWELYRRAACVAPWYSEPAYLARWRQHGEQGGGLVTPEMKVDSVLKTVELGKRYYPPEIAAEVAESSLRHWRQMFSGMLGAERLVQL